MKKRDFQMPIIKKIVSVVIPCYNSEQSIGEVVAEIKESIQRDNRFDYEIILINDSSGDNTFETILDLQKEDNKIVVIDFSRNFGQASAQMAGFNLTRGDYIVSLDDDGQMPIESLIPLIDKAEEGYDVVFGQYCEVMQNGIRNIGSKVNAKMTELLIGKPKDLFISSFWVAKRFVIDEIIKYQGPFPYVGGLLLRATGNMTSIPVKERNRKFGASNYSFTKLLKLWLNGFTAFSILPLRIASILGFAFAAIGFIWGFISLIRKIVNPDILLGYTSIIIAIMLVGGVIMVLLGMLGEYMGRIYLSVNQSPQYVIKATFDNRDTIVRKGM